MALGDNLIGLAVGKVQAENRGVQPPESTRIGVISAMMPNPIMSLVISRSLADKAVASLPPPAPPPPTDPAGGGTGTTPGGQPQTDFERHVAESLAKIEGDITTLKAEVASLKPPPPQPPPPAPPGGQAAPSEPAKEAGGKPGKGGGTP